MDGAEHYVDWTNRGKKRTAQHITGENGVSILKDLCNVADIFEEDAKEAFLPTYFSKEISR